VSLANLIDRLKHGVCPPQSQRVQHDPLPLATAAVLLETAYADGEFSPAEDGNIVEYLRKHFSLDDDSVRDLIREAAEIRSKTIDHFALTHYIRKTATLDERIEIVKTMWRLVYSDGRLSDYENYIVRKLADLLGLEHHVMIDAKMAVLAERGAAG